MIELQKFIIEHSNWKELLSSSPYNLKIKQDEDLYLFKYNQFNSDMSLKICQEARGIIFYIKDSEVKCVCHSFNKFFNYGEKNAAELDWSNKIQITEKIDGNLIQIYYYNNKWCLATSGVINGFNSIDGNVNYGKAFVESCGIEFEEFTKSFDTEFTYFFELVNPRTQVTISYNDFCVYFLGARHNLYDFEVYFESVNSYPNFKGNVRFPERYDFYSPEEVCEYCKRLDKNHEGFVACDATGERLKFKGEEYLKIFHLIGNGPLTIKQFLNYYYLNILDDYYANTNNYNKEKVKSYINAIKNYLIFIDDEWEEIDKLSLKDKKTVALTVKNMPHSKAYIFAKFNNKELTPNDFFNSLSLSAKQNIIEQFER